MIRLSVVFALFLTSTAAVAQETYKCKTPAGMVYQDRPCAGVRYAPEQPPAQVRPAAAPGASVPASDLDRQKAYLATRESERRASDEKQEKERRRAEINEEITRLDSAIAASRSAMDAEMALLQQRKATANNNLAGATYEQALSTEMQAVVARYNGDISINQDRVKHLREELARLK